jgi:hypothetical protein
LNDEAVTILHTLSREIGSVELLFEFRESRRVFYP